MKKLFAQRQILYMPGQYPGILKHWIKIIDWWLYDLRIEIKKLFKFKIKPQISIYKKWRYDLGMWEEKIKLFKIIYYKYSIWRDGKTIIKLNLWKA